MGKHESYEATVARLSRVVDKASAKHEATLAKAKAAQLAWEARQTPANTARRGKWARREDRAWAAWEVASARLSGYQDGWLAGWEERGAK